MLSNEQYIAVAEKVWGLLCGGILTEYDWYLACVEYQTNLTKEEWLKEEVNSWAGFGRTLEAMAQRHYWFEPAFCTDHRYDCISFVHKTLASYPIHNYSLDLLEELIEATHLAALEAVRKEKEDAEGP